MRVLAWGILAGLWAVPALAFTADDFWRGMQVQAATRGMHLSAEATPTEDGLMCCNPTWKSARMVRSSSTISRSNSTAKGFAAGGAVPVSRGAPSWLNLPPDVPMTGGTG